MLCCKVSYDARRVICSNIKKYFEVELDPNDSSLGDKIKELRHSEQMYNKVRNKIRDSYLVRSSSKPVISLHKMAKLLETGYSTIDRLEKNITKQELRSTVATNTKLLTVENLYKVFNIKLDPTDPLLGLNIFEQIQTSSEAYDTYRKDNKYKASKQRDKKTGKIIYFSQHTLNKITGISGSVYSRLRLDAENYKHHYKIN